MFTVIYLGEKMHLETVNVLMKRVLKVTRGPIDREMDINIWRG